MTAHMAKPKKSTKKPAKKAAKKPAAKKPAAKKPAAKKPAKKKPAAMAKKPAPRADYGKSIDGFLAKQPPNLRKIVDSLHDLIMEAARPPRPRSSGACRSSPSAAR